MPDIRRATLDDLDVLLALERRAFQPWRQSSRASLHRSLTSPRQSVWITDDDLAAMVLWHHAKTLRVYGIAVDPTIQGQGIGAMLLQHAVGMSPGKVVLEAAADDERLLAWYERHGFHRERLMPDFYAPGRGAWRFSRR